MKSLLCGTGAFVVCAAIASPAVATGSISQATVASSFVDALRQQRFNDAAAMFAPEARPGGATPARALRRLGAELGGFSTLQPVASLPDGRSIRLEIAANPIPPAGMPQFVQLRYASTAADGQVVFYELNLSADDRPPRLLSLALHLPAPDAPSAKRARAWLGRLMREESSP